MDHPELSKDRGTGTEATWVPTPILMTLINDRLGMEGKACVTHSEFQSGFSHLTKDSQVTERKLE